MSIDVAHEWIDVLPNHLLGPRTRMCKHCAAIQERATTHLWMRVAKTGWRPIVGRCRPRPITEQEKAVLDYRDRVPEGAIPPYDDP